MHEGDWRTVTTAGVFAVTCAVALFLTLVIRPGGFSFGILQPKKSTPEHVPTKEEVLSALTQMGTGTPTQISIEDRYTVLDELSAVRPLHTRERTVTADERLRALRESHKQPQ